jgi:hypothetical protein
MQGVASGLPGAAPSTAVIVYAARYIARIAYSLPVTTLVKVRQAILILAAFAHSQTATARFSTWSTRHA